MYDKQPNFDPSEITNDEIDSLLGGLEAKGVEAKAVVSEKPEAEDQDSLNQEIDSAFEQIAPETKPEVKQAQIDLTAETFAKEAADAFSGKIDNENLTDLKDRYLATVKQQRPEISDAAALQSLRESLSSLHEAYFSLGNAELASEIDSFGRSLETSVQVSTEAGKDFLKRLEAGEFRDIVDANNALDEMMKNSAGKSPEELNQLNAEFNTLFAAASERLTKKTEAGADDQLDMSDEEIESVFDNMEDNGNAA